MTLREECNVFQRDTANDGHCAQLIRWFMLLALIFGLLLIYLNPPFACPDENAHYMNICRIAGGHLFPTVQDGQLGSVLTKNEAEFLWTYSGHYHGLDCDTYTYEDAYYLSHLTYGDNGSTFFQSRLSNINQFSYLPAAIGVGIAKAVFHINNPYNTLLIAKFCNLLFYIIVMAIAIKKTPILKATMTLLALMPMTIYQCSSTSYDALLIPASFLLFAYAAKLLCAPEDYRVGTEDIVAICFAFAFICAVKIAYAPLVLIFLALHVKKFGDIKRYFACIGALAAVAVVFYLIPTLVNGALQSGAENVVFEEVEQQRAYFKAHVFQVFPILFHTIRASAGFWYNSFFGVLGSLDTNFPAPMIHLFYLVLFVVALTEVSTVKKINLRARLLAFAGVAIFFVGTVMAMYLDWTPLATHEIGGLISTGTQGRYFIPVALFMIVIFANPLLCERRWTERAASVRVSAVKGISLAYLILMSFILLTRFWM